MHTAIDAPTVCSINLCDFPELPANIRLDAESGYAKALERALGGAEAVAQAYGAYCYAADGDDSDATPGPATPPGTQRSAAISSSRQSAMRDPVSLPLT